MITSVVELDAGPTYVDSYSGNVAPEGEWAKPTDPDDRGIGYWSHDSVAVARE